MVALTPDDRLTDDEYTCSRCDYMGPGEDTGSRVACPWCDVTMAEEAA